MTKAASSVSKNLGLGHIYLMPLLTRTSTDCTVFQVFVCGYF